MELAEQIFLIVYFGILALLAFYGTHRFLLAYLYRKHKNDRHTPKERFNELPTVTIQLPIYNEMYVAQRLVRATCKMHYPAHALEIQVLDDSTDETQDILKQVVAEQKALGINISYIHRTDRTGFKAGALEAGLKLTQSEYIAIFDADFIPEPDFLEQTVHFFSESKIGMVQVRWEHINRNYSWLTQAQSILLDGHFVVEHTARNRSGCFFNFNGTAGIWRRETITDAGGWQHDTLTEDLDLSYRAQLKNWQFVYLPDITSGAELPVEMNAFKSQQHRWAKGSIQTGRKLLMKVLKSDQPFKVKYEAFMHLTNNIAYLLMVFLSLMMPISLIVRLNHSLDEALMVDLPVFILSTFSVVNFYLLAQKEIGQSFWQRVRAVPMVLSLGIGLAVNNCKAVVEALLGIESDFIRTPKHSIEKSSSVWSQKKYRAKKNILPWIELSLGAYYVWAVGFAAENDCWYSIPFLLLFLVGYIYVGSMSLLQSVLPDVSLAKSAIKQALHPADKNEVHNH